jgi:hypothetical protein
MVQSKVLRRVTRHVPQLYTYIAQLEAIGILRGEEAIRCWRTLVQYVFGADCCGEVAASRQMIRMHVRLDNVSDPNTGRLSFTLVELGLRDWINDHSRGLAAATKEVGGGNDRLRMEELTKDHWAPVAMGNPAARQSGNPSSARRA